MMIVFCPIDQVLLNHIERLAIRHVSQGNCGFRMCTWREAYGAVAIAGLRVNW